jgi:hypothetical protein
MNPLCVVVREESLDQVDLDKEGIMLQGHRDQGELNLQALHTRRAPRMEVARTTMETRACTGARRANTNRWKTQRIAAMSLRRRRLRAAIRRRAKIRPRMTKKTKMTMRPVRL